MRNVQVIGELSTPVDEMVGVTSVPGHFGPKTELDMQFGPSSLRSLDTSVLRT